jgi:hypothetical protein
MRSCLNRAGPLLEPPRSLPRTRRAPADAGQLVNARFCCWALARSLAPQGRWATLGTRLQCLSVRPGLSLAPSRSKGAGQHALNLCLFVPMQGTRSLAPQGRLAIVFSCWALARSLARRHRCWATLSNALTILVCSCRCPCWALAHSLAPQGRWATLGNTLTIIICSCWALAR